MSKRCALFISYRRNDAPGYVRALMSDLRHSLGSGHVFLDIETISAGSDFAEVIGQAVAECELLLAVIGPEWLAINAQGLARIHDVHDFISLEIASALKRNIPVIPVLVDKAAMPTASDLPAQLQAIAYLQAVSLSHEHWEDDMQKLLAAIGNLTVAPRLAHQYESAKLKLKQGYWQEALHEFEALQTVKPDYENSLDIVQPLYQLQQQLAVTGNQSKGWQGLMLDYPLPALLLLSLMPHSLAAIFNYLFNWQVIVHPMQLRGVRHAEQVFQAYAFTLNAVFFVLGLVLLILLCRPISAGLKALHSGALVLPEQLMLVRKHCLDLGHWIAVIGLSMWIIAGPIYPLLINALALRDYVYFIGSLAISGLAVVAYPFLLVTSLCVHVYYPRFVLPGSVTDLDLKGLDQVVSRKWVYLSVAGALPMLVISLGFMVIPHQASTGMVNTLLGVAGLVGLGAFLLALWIFKAIQDDLEFLRLLLWACSPKKTLHKEPDLLR